ncbi:MAG: hypothetical protein LLG13_05440 [Bacteroidales bacterium]|nr:hypothetical protein [Bacteroidales bacterium]
MIEELLLLLSDGKNRTIPEIAQKLDMSENEIIAIHDYLKQVKVLPQIDDIPICSGCSDRCRRERCNRLINY